MKLEIFGLKLSVVALSAICLPWISLCAQIAPIAQISPRDEKENPMAEILIRRRIEDYVKAIRARDLDGVMSLYAPNIVSFDVDPPLRYSGTSHKRRAWQ